jgi:hypothetical protein
VARNINKVHRTAARREGRGRSKVIIDWPGGRTLLVRMSIQSPGLGSCGQYQVHMSNATELTNGETYSK